jgi:hypothetical protein
LCLRVQPLSSSAQVKAGQVASYVVWVWSAKATSDNTSVLAWIAGAKYLDAPRFRVCPIRSGQVCKLGDLAKGRIDELEVGVHVLPKAALGTKVRLTAKAYAKGAHPNSASATYTVVRTPKVSPTSGDTLPPTSLPPIPSTSTSSSNPAGLFPTVGASSSPPTSGAHGSAKKHATVHAATASATVPLDARLIGGQLAGLAVLAGGIAIALVRLSLRRQRAPGGNDEPRPPQ